MDEAVLGHQVDDAVLLGDLHCNREIVGRLRREVDVDSLLGERRVRCLVVNLDNVQLEHRLRP